MTALQGDLAFDPPTHLDPHTYSESSSVRPDLEPQILLILVGLPGSGKSTFSNSLVRHSHSDTWQAPTDPIPDSSPPRKRRKWIRASQDESPNKRRQECEAVVRNGLQGGYNVVVDRVGFDVRQRSHFINLARQIHPRPRIYAVILYLPLPILQSRLSTRTGHPTLPDEKSSLGVLKEMTRVWDPPRRGRREGFDRVLWVDDPSLGSEGGWTEVEVERLLVGIEKEGFNEDGIKGIDLQSGTI